jgi:acetyl esterase/lipase
MLGLLTFCSPATPLNFLARGGDFTVGHEKYGLGARNGVDIYTPDGARQAPVIVFFYGGNWQSGDKATYRFVAASLVARGYVVAVPDYRVYPDVRFAGFMRDGATAVAWVKTNIARFGGDPNDMFLMGHSAGAHIAAMLTLDARWLGKEGIDPRRDIAGLIGVAGPYDFLPLKDETLKVIFSGGDIARTQPITFVKGGAPPALLLTGRKDDIVGPGNTVRLAAKLRGHGDDVTAIEYPAIGHLAIIGAFAPVLRPLAPVVNDVDRFVRAHARSKQSAPRAMAR